MRGIELQGLHDLCICLSKFEQLIVFQSEYLRLRISTVGFFWNYYWLSIRRADPIMISIFVVYNGQRHELQVDPVDGAEVIELYFTYVTVC